MVKDFRPGDVTIEQCEMVSIDGKRRFDLLPQLRNIDLYESLFRPIMYGELIIQDGINLLKGFPILGEEIITLKFNTPTFKSVDTKLCVYNVGEVEVADGNRSQMYTLRVCSPELLTNATTRISKRFNNQIDATVKTLISDNLKTQKNITTEQTRGIDDHLVTNLTPLQVIDKLRHRAVSAKNASSSFVFYENVDGFHFVTLEQLIANGRGKVADKAFFYDDSVLQKVEQVQFRNIIAMEQPQQQNTVDKIQAGGMNNVVRKFDIITGTVNDIKFKSTEYEDIFKKTGDTPRQSTSSFTKQYGEKPAKQFFVPYDSTAETFVPEKVGILHGFVEKITQNIVNIHIWGDSTITIGNLINCSFTAASGMTGDTTKRTVSNNYLVSKVRHMILNSGRPVYSQSLECIGNSYDE